MKIGVLTALFRDRDFESMIKYLHSIGVEAVELATGGYPGKYHINPDQGNLSAWEEVANGFYRIRLLKNNKPKAMLCIDKATAEKVLAGGSMELMFNQSNVIVGIVS